MNDANLHKRLNALGCPQKGRPDEAGQVAWDNLGDLFGDGFRIDLQWDGKGLVVSEQFRASGTDDDRPVWSFRWERRLVEDGRVQWRLEDTQGEALAGITNLEQTVVFAREAIRRIGVAPRWIEPVTSPAVMPARKGLAC